MAIYIGTSKFNQQPFDQTLENKYLIGKNHIPEISILIYIHTDGRLIYSHDYTLGTIFDDYESAQFMLSKLSLKTKDTLLPYKVSDLMIPIYYINKTHFDNNSIPKLSPVKIWMDKDSPIGKNMFTDITQAQNELIKQKITITEFYHKLMVENSMLSFS